MTYADAGPVEEGRTSIAGGWRWLFVAASAGTGLIGAAMVALGAWLVLLGGNLYYLVVGALLAAAAVLQLRRRHDAGLWLNGAAVALTAVWALWEIAGKGWMPSWGFDFAGRVGVLLGVFAVALLARLLGGRSPGAVRARRPVLLAAAVAAVGGVAAVALLWERPVAPSQAQAAQGQAVQERRAVVPGGGPADAAGPDTAGLGRAGPPNRAEEWAAFGGSNLGERYSPAAQITPANVAGLRQAWRFSTGDTAPNDRVYFAAQNTPLKIDDRLYTCSSSNKVFALDPATGAELWRFDPRVSAEAMESMFSVACRSVGYHERPGAADAEACARRIYVATADGRLIALDARDGRPCAGFGQGGTVDLEAGMGLGETGFASSNSGPAVAGDLVLVGQQVSDNQRRDAPSGVVRAYDATSGAPRWAWDAQRLDRPRARLAPGETWPRGTPNVWNVISADEALGLVYLGTGNAANDHWGGTRSPEDEHFSAAVVAVEMASGQTRWSFSTVDKDRWDYDIGAQPVVTDLVVDGVTRRAVVQATKTGEFFALDAATGAPLRRVERRPAPGGAPPGDELSPTQPRSAFFPSFAGAPGPEPERIDARHAFGLTPIDAAWCRVQYHRMRYEGIYTPPTDRGLGTLLVPGIVGGVNWGGIAVDRARGVAVVNSSRLANRVLLVPRERVQDAPIGGGGARPDQEVAPQQGAPWGVVRPTWLSPLGVPCTAPPWGYLSAVDLASGRMLWSQPLGTGFDAGPLGIPTLLRVRIGTPNQGGPVATATGLTFIAAAQDNYLRAFETATGRLLWSGRLPAGGQASAMTYVHRGRQHVVINAAGHARLQTEEGDSVIAFALE